MSDATPTKGLKQWTDAEKLGIFFQIITKGGPIPWQDLELPEGRTLKAVQMMIEKEKAKVRKAQEQNGQAPTTPTPTQPKKRGPKAMDADNDQDDEADRKVKTPRKKKGASSKYTNGGLGKEEADDEAGDVAAEDSERDVKLENITEGIE